MGGYSVPMPYGSGVDTFPNWWEYYPVGGTPTGGFSGYGMMPLPDIFMDPVFGPLYQQYEWIMAPGTADPGGFWQWVAYNFPWLLSNSPPAGGGETPPPPAAQVPTEQPPPAQEPEGGFKDPGSPERHEGPSGPESEPPPPGETPWWLLPGAGILATVPYIIGHNPDGSPIWSDPETTYQGGTTDPPQDPFAQEPEGTSPPSETGGPVVPPPPFTGGVANPNNPFQYDITHLEPTPPPVEPPMPVPPVLPYDTGGPLFQSNPFAPKDIVPHPSPIPGTLTPYENIPVPPPVEPPMPIPPGPQEPPPPPPPEPPLPEPKVPLPKNPLGDLGNMANVLGRGGPSVSLPPVAPVVGTANPFASLFPLPGIVQPAIRNLFGGVI